MNMTQVNGKQKTYIALQAHSAHRFVLLFVVEWPDSIGQRQTPPQLITTTPSNLTVIVKEEQPCTM